jgi:aminomethyltransferase
MGYPLYGHELSADISPVEAGLSWAIGWDKPAFIGREALVRQRTLGLDRRSRGLRCVDRAVPRPGMAVRTEGGQPLGVVTSGTFSPTLRLGIALALLSPQVQLGDIVEIDVRGRPRRSEVVPVPFVNANPRG